MINNEPLEGREPLGCAEKPGAAGKPQEVELCRGINRKAAAGLWTDRRTEGGSGPSTVGTVRDLGGRWSSWSADFILTSVLSAYSKTRGKHSKTPTENATHTTTTEMVVPIQISETPAPHRKLSTREGGSGQSFKCFVMDTNVTGLPQQLTNNTYFFFKLKHGSSSFESQVTG